MACLEMLNIAVGVPQQNTAFRYLHGMHCAGWDTDRIVIRSNEDRFSVVQGT